MRNVTQDELNHLLAAVNRRKPLGDQDYWLIVLAAHTGLRVSELAGLDVSMVARQGEPRAVLFVPRSLGKCGKERSVPMNARAREAVAGLLDFKRRRGFSVAPEAPLFVTASHKRISVRTIEHHIQQLREQAECHVPVSPHSFRHFFLSRVVSEGASLITAKDLAGHARVATVQIYAHSSPAELARAVRAIE